jgi:hypothetical protein
MSDDVQTRVPYCFSGHRVIRRVESMNVGVCPSHCSIRKNDESKGETRVSQFLPKELLSGIETGDAIEVAKTKWQSEREGRVHAH